MLKYAVGSRPLLLILDGHSTHYQPALIKYAKENQVILLCLAPHTTHESQPLDASVFKPLKQNWNDACHKFMEQNPGKVITKYNFSPLLNEAWTKTMTPTVICSGFKRAGIYPFNPNVINYGVSASSEESVMSTGATRSQHPASSEESMMSTGATRSQHPVEFTLGQEQLFKKGLKRNMTFQIQLISSG